jgi:hypothetical protein
VGGQLEPLSPAGYRTTGSRSGVDQPLNAPIAHPTSFQILDRFVQDNGHRLAWRWKDFTQCLIVDLSNRSRMVNRERAGPARSLNQSAARCSLGGQGPTLAIVVRQPNNGE